MERIFAKFSETVNLFVSPKFTTNAKLNITAGGTGEEGKQASSRILGASLSLMSLKPVK